VQLVASAVGIVAMLIAATPVGALSSDASHDAASRTNSYQLEAQHIARLLDKATREYAGSFAGGYLEDDGTVVVGFTSDAPARLSALLHSSGRDFETPFRPHTAAISLEDLTARQKQVETAIVTDPEVAGLDWSFVDADETAGIVRLGVADGEDARIARLRETLDFDLVIETAEAVTTACSRTVCVDEAFRAGLSILTNPPQGPSACTTGFSANRAGVGLGFYTSGHCTQLNDRVFHSAYPVGRTHNTHFYDGSKADAAWIAMDANYVTLFGGTSNWVYRSETSKRYSITSVGTGGLLGDRMCFTGVSSNKEVCGNVVRTDFTVNYGGIRLYEQNAMASCPLPGDSGGPVYYSGRAHGLLSGHLIDQNGNCAGETVYSTMDHVRSVTGTSVRTS
jgi:hypothetical protein